MAWPGGWLCTHSQSVVLNFDTFDVYRQDRQGCRASCQGFLQGGAGMAQCGDSDKPLELHLFAGTLPDVIPASNTGMTSFLFTEYAFTRAGVASSATARLLERGTSSSYLVGQVRAWLAGLPDIFKQTKVHNDRVLSCHAITHCIRVCCLVAFLSFFFL